MKNTEELQNRLKAAEAEIAEVRRLIQEEESKSKPPKWEDLGEVEGYWIGTDSDIHFAPTKKTNRAHENIFPTKEQAAATVAEAQLLQLRDSKFYRNGWKPDWGSVDAYCLSTSIYGWQIVRFTNWEHIWSFQDKETAERFLNEQRDLLEIWSKKIRS